MLNGEEESLNEELGTKDSIFALAATATPRPGGNFNQSSGNFSHHNGGRGRGSFNYRGGRGGRNAGNQSPHYNHFTSFQSHQLSSSLSTSRLDRSMCQICNKLGHTTIDCYHRMDYAYQGKHPPTKLGAMATASNASLAQEQPWLAYNVVTDHVIANLDQLNFP